MSRGTQQEGREAGNGRGGGQVGEDQVKQITEVVLQTVETRWGIAKEDVKELHAFIRAVNWVFAHWAPVVTIFSVILLVLGLLIFRVPPLQVLEGPVKNYRQAQLQQDMVSRHNELGNGFLSIGQPRVAKTEFEQALQLDPTNPTAELGVLKCELFIPILEEEYNLEVMEQRVKLLMQETPNDTHGYVFLGNIFQSAYPKKALSYYDQAIEQANEQDSSNAHAYYSKGSVYEGQGDLDKALRMYERAHSEAEWNPLYQQAIAYVLYKQKHYEKARAKYENLVHWEPQYLWAYSDLALIYQLLGHVKIADYYQEQLIALLKDESLISMEKNRGTLAFNTRVGPVYLSQPSEKLYYVYFSAAWTSYLLGDGAATDNFMARARAEKLDSDREWEIKQIVDDNIAVLLSRRPGFAPQAAAFRRDFISNEAASLGKGVPQDGPVPSPDADDLGTEERAVHAVVRGHYEAMGEGGFERAFSYFGPDYRGMVDQGPWAESQEIYGIRESTINSLEVDRVEGETATATVDVSFEDNTGTPRFLVTWNLVKVEDGEWKLNKALSIQRLN